MLGIGPSINEIINTNLVISTASAKILAEQFKSSSLEFWLPLITSIAAAFAALMSYFASKKSADMSHRLFVNELNKEYVSIKNRWWNEFNPNFEEGVSNKNKDGMCNFFEKLCNLYYQNVIKERDFLHYSVMLKTQILVKYADKQNKKDRVLGSYIRWLCENNVIKR